MYFLKTVLMQHTPIIGVLLFSLCLGLFYQFYVLSGVDASIWPVWTADIFIGIMLVLGVDFFVRKNHRSAEGYIGIVALYIAVSLILVMVMHMKSLIGYIHPYGTDEFWAKLDYALLLGHYPFELFHISSWPVWVIHWIDMGYCLWFLVMAGWVAYVFTHQDVFYKQRILVTYVLCWIVIGVGCATFMSSVGPIFWADYYDGVNPYQAHIDYLRQVDSEKSLIVFYFYDLLTGFQSNDSLIDFNAPSAMPSMHVGVAALIYFSVPHQYKLVRCGALLFLALTIVGSVVLGWHYIADSYVAIIATYAMWRFVCKGMQIFQNKVEP